MDTKAFFALALSELIGTLVLILFGNGVGFSVSHKRMFANQPGKWIVITIGWGFAVMMGVIVAQAIATRLGVVGVAHLNPAVSFFGAVSSKQPELLGLIPFQFIGAILGQVILDFINWNHIKETDLATVRGSHCTGPAFENKGKSTIFNFSYEFVGTLALIGIIAAFGALKLDNLGPLPVTFLVMAIGISLGSSTGYAINPARDLGPRALYALLEKTLLKSREKELVGANWSYSWVPVVAPCLAGILVGGLTLI